MKGYGKMISKVDLELIIGLMEKYSTRLSRIYIKGTGSMDKDVDLDVFTIRMDADFRVILAEIKKMEWESSWIKMEIAKSSTSKTIKLSLHQNNRPKK